ncbi:hypothetical protein ABIE64_002933 [Thalassospira sp. MBR-102]|uniref:hypothetical protein n=1 Tax=Thalassospira sp. MBR-102 TaxID=3156466 RepID=UPI00339920E9
MSKKTVLLVGGLAVLAAAGAGLHYKAPAYLENRFRTILSSPDSDLRGEFSDFEMSLLGRTLAARNVKLIDPNGVTYTIGSMHLNQVNWLTLIGANPFGNGIAGQADLEELAIAHDAYGITTPKAELGDLAMDLASRNFDITTGRADLQNLTISDGDIRRINIDHLLAENAGSANIDALNITGWKMDDQETKITSSIDNMTFVGCAGPADLIASFDPDIARDFAICDDISATTLSFADDAGLEMSVDAIALSGLESRVIKSGTLTGLSMQQPDNPARLAIGEISLADFRVDLTGDMIDLDTRLSMADARKMVENTSFQTIIVKNPVISDEEVEIALDNVTLRDMRDGRLAGIDITGSHITQKTPDGPANFGLDGLSVTDLDLMAITGFGEIYDVADEMVGQHIDQFEDFTLGQMNLPLSQALYGAFSINGLSFSGAPDGEKVEIRLDSFKSTLEKPFTPENSALTFVKINNSTLEGLHATLDDSITGGNDTAIYLGINSFDDLVLDVSNSIIWDETAGDFVYSIDKVALRDIGQIGLSVTVTGINDDVMTRLLKTRIGDDAALEQALTVDAAFRGARLEISGEKMLPFALGVASLLNGNTAEDMKMLVTMNLMQAQEQFADDATLYDAFGELLAWVDDPRHLLIELAPQEPVAMGMAAGGLMFPQMGAQMLGLRITANGQ